MKTFTQKEVLELMDKVTIHFITEKNSDETDLIYISLLSMATTNVFFTNKYKPKTDSLEAKILKVATRDINGSYDDLLIQKKN